MYSANSVELLKHGNSNDLQITTPFALGVLTEDVKDDHCYSVNVTLFLPSFDDCLTFCTRAITIHHDALAVEVETA